MTQSQSVHLALVWGGRRGAGKRVKLCQKFLELFLFYYLIKAICWNGNCWEIRDIFYWGGKAYGESFYLHCILGLRVQYRTKRSETSCKINIILKYLLILSPVTSQWTLLKNCSYSPIITQKANMNAKEADLPLQVVTAAFNSYVFMYLKD